MDIINSSQDIFFLVLSFCILWLTIFLAWIMYYGIQTVRQLYDMVSSLKRKLDAVDEIIRLVKSKISVSASYLTLLVSGVKKVVELLGDKEEKPSKKKR